ncbi:pathogenesis-related protein 1-like [Melia azedarach]|uniref:Pathogenesis-related protein 1-like n=2 Tax=Melia azedarach TaxID=155640 RepID=A0ACC1XDZ4_MELAZ|nr:pathogenesis-related protein 1-like [Melia azedarach]KAJ4709701.1 pathogenesis-related protein 1-like [Melia azedarach]
MEIRLLFSYGLILGTFLIFSSLPSLSLSDSRHNFLARRLATESTGKSTIQQYLAPHNIVRAKLGLPPLKWSKKLANFSSWWAHQRQRDCELAHSNSSYGENLFWGSGKNWKPGDAVAAWAQEKSYYDHKTNSCTKNKDCLHYTQMVWRQSLKVGCARVVCKSGDTFITCNYDPHGNVIGQKPF